MRRRDFIRAITVSTVWPLAAHAQALPVIGFMSARSPEDTAPELKAFHTGLGEGGFTDGSNTTIEYRWARGDYRRLPLLADELLQRHVSVLVATGGDASARAAKAATTTVPVVFNMGSDPVRPALSKALIDRAATSPDQSF